MKPFLFFILLCFATAAVAAAPVYVTANADGTIRQPANLFSKNGATNGTATNSTLIVTAKIGIATNTPTAALEVQGNATISGRLNVTGNQTNSGDISMALGTFTAGGISLTGGSATSRGVLAAPSDGTWLFRNGAGNGWTGFAFGVGNVNWPFFKRVGAGFSIEGGVGGGTSTNHMLVAGTVAGTNGIASYATDAAAPVGVTGWTNTFTKNAVVYYDGIGLTAILHNNAGTPIYTNAATSIHLVFPVQAGGKILITAGSSITGFAVPW